MKREMAFSDYWVMKRPPERESAVSSERQRNIELLLPRIAARYAGRREIIHVPAVTKTIEEEQLVKIPIERIFEEDAGPIWWLWLVLAASLLLGAILSFAADTTLPLSLLGLGGGGVFIALRGRYRTVRRRTVTEQRDTYQKVPREIVVTPKSFEEHMLPGHLEVSAVGRLSLPSIVVQACQGTMLLAPGTGAVSSQQLEYPELRTAQELRQTLDELNAKTSRLPHVLKDPQDHSGGSGSEPDNPPIPLRGLEQEIYQGYMKVARLASEIDRTVFSFAPVPAGHPLLPLLRPVSRTWPDELFLQGRALEQKLRGENGEALDRLFADAIHDWAQRQLVIHAVRLNSLSEGVAPLCRELGQMFEYSAFNFYCPTCSAEYNNELLSRDYSLQAEADCLPTFYLPETRCVFDPNRTSWHCPACGTETLHPVPVHRMLEEVMLPAYDHLLEENRQDRMSLYSRAREQERSYQNQMEVELEELIRKNREAVESLRTERQHNEAEVQGELRALQSLRELRQGYPADQNQAIQKIFAEQMSIQRNMEEQRIQVCLSLDQMYEASRRDIQARLSMLQRAEYLEKRKRDEAQASTLLQLQRLQGNGQSRLQEQEDLPGDMKERGGEIPGGVEEFGSDSQEGYCRCSAIAAAAAPGAENGLKSLRHGIAGHARNAMVRAAGWLTGEDPQAADTVKLENR